MGAFSYDEESITPLLARILANWQALQFARVDNPYHHAVQILYLGKETCPCSLGNFRIGECDAYRRSQGNNW